MNIVWAVLILSMSLFGARVVETQWPNGYTLLTYLYDHNITILPDALPDKLKKSSTAIKAGEVVYEARSENSIEQALIKISDNRQIHIYRDDNGAYNIETIPIAYHTIEDTVSIRVGQSLKRSIEQKTNNKKLTFLLSRLISDKALFRSMRPDTRVVFVYTQKERMGRPFGAPYIKSALIDQKNKDTFAYMDQKKHRHKGIYKKIAYTVMEKRPFTYTTVKKIPAPNFRMPVAHPRITSKFSLRRWHPIQHKYKPHHGVDFGGKTGTPLYATDDGIVIYAGWMNGYGKTTKIRHAGGYVSLYGHQSRIMVKNGQRVKRGKIIGKLGNTGRSTGPHLHYGLMKNGRWVDPLKYIGKKSSQKPKIIRTKHTVIKKYPVKKYKNQAIPYAKKIKQTLQQKLKEQNIENYKWIDYERNIIYINDIMVDKKSQREVDDG